MNIVEDIMRKNFFVKKRWRSGISYKKDITGENIRINRKIINSGYT